MERTDGVRSRRGGVVITGASSGIGEACARRLDARGFRVFAGVRREEDAARLRSVLSERSAPLMLDVIDAVSIRSAIESVAAAVGADGLAGLVNNAGVAVAGPLEFLPLDDFRRQMEVNVTGQIAVTQAALPLLRRGCGRIVLMGSIGGRETTPFLGPYCASKHALEAIADALRVELQPWGIHVSIVEPGSIATPIWTKSDAAAQERVGRLSPDALAGYGQALEKMRQAAAAAGRRGAPADAVAEVVEHALRAPTPRTRYLVGRDAKLRARLGAFLTDRMEDRILTRLLGLPRPGAFAGRRS